MKRVILSRLLASLSVLGTVSVPAIANQPSSSQCTTWEKFSRGLPPQSSGRGGQWRAFGDLPPKFQNGCILLDSGNSFAVAYALKQGISIKYYSTKPTSSLQRVPAFKYEQQKALEHLVDKGDALKVTWLIPTNGSLRYLQSIPRNRAFLREDGMTCFSTVCMKSGALSHEDLAKILGNRRAN